jgi:fatty-acyl-CoA synthase
MIHADVIGERSRLSADKTALVYVPTRQSFTYRELNDRAIRCARLWNEPLGLVKGDRVGILAENRVEFLDAFFAAGKTGIILVPLNTRLTAAELLNVVRDSGIKALLYGGDFVETVSQLKRERVVQKWVAFDTLADDADLNYGHLTSKISTAGFESNHCDPEDLYCLLYTSGTTGKPKGVMIPHRMVAWNGYNTAICWQLREEDVSPVFTPLYHAGGLFAFLVPILTAGGTIVLHRGFDAGEIWRAIGQYRCTVVLGVPTIFRMLLDAPEFEQADLSSVSWFISGGAPLLVDLVEAYRTRGIVLRQGYGLTEVGVNCFSMSSEDAIRKAGSIGKPLMFTGVRLANTDSGDPSAGEVGELLFRGPHVCKGYWNDPEATAAAIDPDGWFHTGDVARRDDQGFYYVVGRLKDMFISGGVNVYPAEVESELLKHAAISDAAVIGVPHPTWGEVGAAFVVSSQPTPPTSEALKNFLAKNLAKYKIPQEFLFLESLPRTAYGKVKKPELRELFRRISISR